MCINVEVKQDFLYVVLYFVFQPCGRLGLNLHVIICHAALPHIAGTLIT